MKFQTQLKQNAAHYRKNEIFNLHKDPNVTNISSYCLLHYIQSEYIKPSYYFHYFIWITIAPIVQGIISRDSISASEDSESKIASSIHKRNGKILKHIKQVSASSTSNLSRQKNNTYLVQNSHYRRIGENLSCIHKCPPLKNCIWRKWELPQIFYASNKALLSRSELPSRIAMKPRHLTISNILSFEKSMRRQQLRNMLSGSAPSGSISLGGTCATHLHFLLRTAKWDNADWHTATKIISWFSFGLIEK